MQNLELDRDDVYEIKGPLDLTFLNKFIDLPGWNREIFPYTAQQNEELPDYEGPVWQNPGARYPAPPPYESGPLQNSWPRRQRTRRSWPSR